MSGLVIETIRPGAQFTPEAAAAWRRAEPQVREEFGRDIDVNSTYRSWDQQMAMHLASLAYQKGRGPYPGHSYATHPRNSFHVAGLAVDSDDWRIPRLVEILADHGFIRNRLYVEGEEHHFEYIRDRDQHYGEPLAAAPKKSEEDDMKAIRKAGVPNSGIIIQAATPPYSLPDQVYDALRGAYGLDSRELQGWMYDTAVREQWAAAGAAASLNRQWATVDVDLGPEDLQGLADATAVAVREKFRTDPLS